MKVFIFFFLRKKAFIPFPAGSLLIEFFFAARAAQVVGSPTRNLHFRG